MKGSLKLDDATKLPSTHLVAADSPSSGYYQSLKNVPVLSTQPHSAVSH